MCRPSRADPIHLTLDLALNLHGADGNGREPVEAESMRRRGGKIDDAAACERAAVVDADIDHAAVALIGDLDGAAERQSAVRRCQRLGVDAFAARGLVTVVGIDRSNSTFGKSRSGERTTQQASSSNRSCGHPQSPANMREDRHTHWRCGHEMTARRNLSGILWNLNVPR